MPRLLEAPLFCLAVLVVALIIALVAGLVLLAAVLVGGSVLSIHIGLPPECVCGFPHR